MLPSARDTALQPLSKLQWRVQCCEASGSVPAKASGKEGSGMSEHSTHSCYSHISAKMMNRLKQKLQQTAGQILCAKVC